MAQKIILSEADILLAMRYHEKRAGPGDGISICKEVSQLADLLGAMWFAHEAEALVRVSSPVAVLVMEAQGAMEGGSEDGQDADCSAPAP